MLSIILALAISKATTATYNLPRIEQRYTIAENNQRKPEDYNKAAPKAVTLPHADTKPLDCTSGENAKTAECEDAENNRRIAAANEHMVTLTSVIVLAGIIQTFALVFTLKATQKSATAAKDSADAAIESVRLSERSLKITERAYLEIDKIALPKKLEINEIPRIVVWLTNRGRTPATIISATSRFQIFSEIPEDPAFYGESPCHILVGPSSSASHDVTTEQAVTLDIIKEVHAGRKHFVVWGRVIYLDVFAGRHETRFGALLRFHDYNEDAGTHTTSFKHLPLEKYNYTD